MKTGCGVGSVYRLDNFFPDVELAGHAEKILQDDVVGTQAQSLFEDGMLQQIVDGNGFNRWHDLESSLLIDSRMIL